MPIIRRKKYFRLFVFMLILLPVIVKGQQPKHSSIYALGVEFGHWAPSRLIDQEQLTSIKASRKSPYWGLAVEKFWRSFSLRFSGGYWHFEPEGSEKTIQIGSVEANMKYQVLSGIWFMPYVIYGGGCFLGNSEALNASTFEFLNDPEIGYGLNLGAGFDFRIQPVDIAFEFKYHYVVFNNQIETTTNYSGPKVSLQLFYLFKY